MSNGYSDVPTRDRGQGALDKAVLMTAVADSLTEDRDFDQFVMRQVAGAPNGGDDQAMCWATYCENLPYRRESGEKYREWREVVGLSTGQPCGGDCDDLTIVLVAGLKTLGLQSFVEILTDEEGWGFHVRGRVGMPPHNPSQWLVVDPVWKSERQWAGIDKDQSKTPLALQSEQIQTTTQPSQSTFLSQLSGQMSLTPKSSTMGLALSLLAGWGVWKWWKTARK